MKKKIAHYFIVRIQTGKQEEAAEVDEVQLGASVISRVKLIKCMPQGFHLLCSQGPHLLCATLPTPNNVTTHFRYFSGSVL